MKIAVSACLLGTSCKYSGGHNRNEAVLAFLSGHEVLPVCPETAGGLPVPRTPAEKRGSRVIDRNGTDRTEAFRTGAQAELKRVLAFGAELAVLQPRSPSCGVTQVYDGTFTGSLIPGEGVFAQLLREHGIRAVNADDPLITGGHAR